MIAWLKVTNMRITNIRRGRIGRIAAICVILLCLVYALHKWSYKNVAVEHGVPEANPQVGGSFKSHEGVLPELRTGKVINIAYWHSILFSIVNVQLHALQKPACKRVFYVTHDVFIAQVFTLQKHVMVLLKLADNRNNIKNFILVSREIAWKPEMYTIFKLNKLA